MSRPLSFRAVLCMGPVALLACGGGGEPNAAGVGAPLPDAGTPSRAPVAARAPAGSAAPVLAAAAVVAPAVPSAAALFESLKPKLVACYEQGRSGTPTMLDGKLTLNASVDASGKPTCVIPSYATGLTHEVEDCMSARFLEGSFAATGAPWSAALPVVVRQGMVKLDDAAPAATGFESIETYRMPDAFEVLESLVPALQGCMQEAEKSSRLRSVLVGARVGTDGRAQCALATSASLPPKVSECAAGVLRGAKFPAPKGGAGLVLVPISVGSK